MNADTLFLPLDGGCKCGKVRLRMEAAPIITHCCHCRQCQKSSRSAFSVNAMIETAKLTILEGTPQSVEAKGSSGAASQTEVRCADCGSTLWSHHPKLGEAVAFVGVGVLDQGERLPPEAHYFTRSKHPWVAVPPDVPSFEEIGYPEKPEARARIAAVL